MSLSESDKACLLRIARSAVEAASSGRDVPVLEAGEGVLNERRGAFVSLHKQGRLRGCIGVFAADKPLCETVAEMAVAAASQDPRFPPVSPDELGLLQIEISVLSPLREISDPSEIEVGRHGIYIIKGLHSGVLLPQVAVEHGFDRETFLDQTCIKAGLPPGCWREGARILVFEAEIFKEKA